MKYNIAFYSVLLEPSRVSWNKMSERPKDMLSSLLSSLSSDKPVAIKMGSNSFYDISRHDTLDEIYNIVQEVIDEREDLTAYVAIHAEDEDQADLIFETVVTIMSAPYSISVLESIKDPS